jgi:hypothetical protein
MENGSSGKGGEKKYLLIGEMLGVCSTRCILLWILRYIGWNAASPWKEGWTGLFFS